MDSTQYDALPIEAVKKVFPGVVSIVISKYMPTMQNALPMMPFPNPFGSGPDTGEKAEVKAPFNASEEDFFRFS